jgi:PPK2 family polyphosphate:nucleotide phosphotransferase
MGKPAELGKLFCYDGTRKIRLDEIDPGQKTGLKARNEAEVQTDKDIAAITALQERLYAAGKQALLVVFQAMDAGGKDGTVGRIFGPVDPLGIRATNFKRPTAEELAHDFLWRIHKNVPARGEIGIFNRSHYEDVLVARVRQLAPRDVVERRYQQINEFERMLAENATRIVKFFLHISKDEQRERLQERVDMPRKRWKFNPDDLKEREFWDSYMEAYELAVDRCATPWAPWYVIPANRNWYRNALVACIVRATLEDMKPAYPAATFDPSGIQVV